MRFEWFQLAQLLSLFFACYFFRYLKQWKIGVFLPLLIFIFVIETIGINFRVFSWKDNYFVYNLYLLLATPLWLYIFRQMLDLSGTTLVIFRLIAVLCMSFLVINYFNGEGVTSFNTWSLLLQMILTIVFSSLILFRLSFADDVHNSLYRHPFFWISAGNLLFGIVTLVLLGLQPYIRDLGIRVHSKSLYYAILPAANILLYTSYCYGFYLCRAAQHKSS